MNLIPRALLALVFVTSACVGLPARAQEVEEFNGPFSSYLSVKSAPYNAVGDGAADDTAAIQAAINALGSDENKVVLYFPAGTYKITSTLHFPTNGFGRLAEKVVIGESPANTILKWAGPAAGDLMWLRRVHTARWGRFTVDGSGTARAAIRIERDGANGAEVSHYLQFHDIVMKNAQYGYLNSDDLDPYNDMDAEISILRCKFLNCTEAGFYTVPGNGFDYWIRDSEFDNCKVGAGSFNGDFRVWHSIFRNSGEVDVYVKGHRDAGIHGNFSQGSKRFAYIQSSNGLIRDNVVIDSVETDTIRLSNDYWRQGSLVIMDNKVRSKSGVSAGPVIRELLRTAGDGKTAGLAIIGNQFTVSNPLQLTPNPTLTYGNETVTFASISPTAPTIPSTPPKVARQVFTVTDASDLQAKIDQAAAYAQANPGSRPVVHLPSGHGKLTAYRTTSTITVPGNLEFSIVGDGGMSRLGWKGAPGEGPVLLLKGPSRVTLRDIFFIDDVTPSADIVIEEADQPNARILSENSQIGGGGLFADSLVNTQIDLNDTLPYRIKVKGGASDGPSRVGWFAGASSGGATYEVEGGGKLLIQDVWFEDGGKEVVLKAHGASNFDGRLMVTSSYIFNNAGPTQPMTVVDGFRGYASFLGAHLISGVAVTNGGQTKHLDLLADHEIISGSAGQSYSWTFNAMPTYSESYLNEHLSFLRATRSERIYQAKPPGVTDVRLHRLNIYIGGERGIHVMPGTLGSSPSGVSAPIFSIPTGTYTTAQSVTISSMTPGATIRYTTDGSDPTPTTGIVYSGPVSVSANGTLKAIATTAAGHNPSTVATASYTIR